MTNRKSAFTAFLLTLFLSACVAAVKNTSPQLIETATPFSLPPTWTPLPSITPPTITATPEAINLISMEPTPIATATAALTYYEIPVFPDAQDVSYDFVESITGEPKTSVIYSVSAAASEVEDFYKEALTADGWVWVYTDSGESLTADLLSPRLMMEFQRDGHKLGVAIHGFMGSGLVLAGVDISAGELSVNFVGAVSGGLDWMGPSELDTRPDAMHFSSTLIEFSHSFYWLPTDQLMEIYHSDKAVIYRPHQNSCKINMEICFVNFWAGSHFDISISIRAHPEMAGLTLEEADAHRWEELNSIAAAPERKYYFPEELAVDGSLESIGVDLLTLGDGTPAIQRTYRWKQEDVEEPIISTYTLFMSGDSLIEFHTDFVKEEWEEWQPTVHEVIAGMKTVP